jgi:predicted dehydrogenase
MDHGPHFFATARLFNGMTPIERVNALPRAHGEGRESHLRGVTSVTWMYEGGEADGLWMQADTEPEAGRYVGFHTEVVGTKGSILVFGEGGGSAPGFPQVAPVTLYANGTETYFDPEGGEVGPVRRTTLITIGRTATHCVISLVRCWTGCRRATRRRTESPI